MFYTENGPHNLELEEPIEISDTEEEEIVTPKIAPSSKKVQNIPSLQRFSNRKDFTVSVIKDENNDDFDKYFIKLLVKNDNGWKCRECKDKFSFRKVAEKHIRTVHMKDKTALQNQVTQLLNRVNIPQQKSNFSHYPSKPLKSILKNSTNSSPNSSGEFTCDVCGEQCNNKTRFRTHTMTYKHYFTCTYCESTYRKRNELTKHKEVCQNKNLPTIKPKIQARTILPAKNLGTMNKVPNPHRPSTNYSHYPSGPPRPPPNSYNSTYSIIPKSNVQKNNATYSINPKSNRPNPTRPLYQPTRRINSPFIRPKSSLLKPSYTCQFCGFENNPEKLSLSYSPNTNTFTCSECGRECSKTKSKALSQWENAHAPVGYARASQSFSSRGFQSYKKPVENNTPAGLLASLFPQGYQGSSTNPLQSYQNEDDEKIDEEVEAVSKEEEVKVQPKTWEAAEDKGFPPGWKWKQSNPWSRRLKFIAPEGKVFASRVAAAKYMEAQGCYTRDQIEKVKNTDDLGEKQQKSEDKKEVSGENNMEEEATVEEEATGDISLEERIEEIRKSLGGDLESKESSNTDLEVG